MAEPASAQRVVRRYNQLHTERMVWDRTRQDIADYVLPRRSNIIWRRWPGARQTWLQMDSTAEQAAHRVASSLLVTACSPSQKWFGLKTRERYMNEVHEVAVWLEECAARMYLALSQCNFNQEITEFFLDLAVFGSACLFIEELTPRDPPRFGGLNFRCNAWGSYVWAESITGTVDSVYRRFEMPVRNIVKQWPDVPDDLKQAASDAPDRPYGVIHGVYPRDDANGRKANAREMPWASCYVLERGPTLLAESGYREFPFAAARWSKAAGETYGRGLGDAAYGDIRTLNRYVELDLAAGEKEVDPPLEAVQDMVIGDISLRPADITYVQQRGQVGRLLQGPSTWTAAHPRIEGLRSSIREAFYYSELDLPRGPAMTATEVQIRWERVLMLLGASLPRVQTEGLTPVVGRVFALMLRANALPPIPEALQAGGATIDVQYEGQLARAQRAQDALAIEAWTQWIGGIGQVKPEVWDAMRLDDAARLMAEVRGVPANIVQDQRIVQQMRQARQKIAMEQYQLDQATQVAQGVGKAAPMVKALPQAFPQDGGQGGEAAPPETP